MKPITVVLDTTLRAAPFSAPLGTSVPTLQAVPRFSTIAAARRYAHECEARGMSPRCAAAHHSTAAFVAGNALFAHIGNVVALPARRGLAQPAV